MISVHLSHELLNKCGLFYNEETSSDSDDSTNEVVRIKDYFEKVIPAYTDRQFQSHFRISRTTFEYVLPLIVNLIRKVSVIGRLAVNYEKQFLAVLWLLATPDSYR